MSDADLRDKVASLIMEGKYAKIPKITKAQKKAFSQLGSILKAGTAHWQC